MNDKILAIDIGGSHIKMVMLNEEGVIIKERSRLPTPKPATPDAVINIIGQLSANFEGYTKAAAGFPGFVKNNVVHTAPNLGTSFWQGTDLAARITQKLSVPAVVVNDADFQGVGLITGHGLEMVVTLGTGFGTALLQDGKLLPHLELSHLPVTKTKNYDQYIGQAAFDTIGAKRWNKRMVKVLHTLKTVFNYDILYISGGNAEKLSFPIDDNVKITNNEAGFKGAAALWRNINAMKVG